jgi:2-keto-3-deoxy-L-rhamnonate aldolase RhmA
MPAHRNPARVRLENDELSLGIGLRQARTVDIAKAMKTSGYDWLFIDLEHNSMDLDMAVQISVAALDAGIAPLVRVPWMQHWMATRVLDGGALGIVMPHVDNVDQAREVADRLKYPPVGHRSIAGGMPYFDFEAVNLTEAAQIINAESLVVVMIETPEAVNNADEIAAVDGIDVLLIGTNDLCAEMNIHGQVGHERVVEAYDKVITACRKHGKWSGMGGVYVEDQMAKYIEMGVRMILSGNDLSMMMAAASQRSAFLRGCQ